MFSTTTPAPAIFMRASASSTRGFCGRPRSATGSGATCALCPFLKPNTPDFDRLTEVGISVSKSQPKKRQYSAPQDGHPAQPMLPLAIYTSDDGNDGLWHGNCYAFPGGRIDRRTGTMVAG